jgi:hypothetical protein
MKKIPKGIMHEPAVMAWAETTPLSEHKVRETNKNVEIINGTKTNPLPLTRATTELRRAYPYIFDCAAYVITHNPEKIETDLFYSRFTMPYHVFLNYCLDDCTEQTQYLKEEMYKLLKGQPAKYIKVSETRTVFAQPVIIALSSTDIKTGKDKRITNLGQDSKVNLIQVQILNELLNKSHGYLNVPKAFFAKIKQCYDALLNTVSLPNRFWDLGYRDKITLMKDVYGPEMSTKETVDLLTTMREQETILRNMPQGGYHAVYLALEYIIAKRGKNKKSKHYSFLELCEKCYPELVRRKDEILYFKDKKKVDAFFIFLGVFVKNAGSALGILDLKVKLNTSRDTVFTVLFS